ncbi:MAG: hypothetical protein ABIW84_00335 [Ilumatobacteraceae bacterium]
MAQNDFTAVTNAGGTQAAEVKAASTAAVAGDPALVVVVSPNNAVMPKATSTAQVKQVTIGTSAAQADASPLSNRKSVEIAAHPDNTGIVYVGFGSGVTTTGSTGGRPLKAQQSIALDVDSSVTIYCIASASGQIISTTEVGGT